VRQLVQKVVESSKLGDLLTLKRCLSIVSEMRLICEALSPKGRKGDGDGGAGSKGGDIYSLMRKSRHVGILRKNAHKEFAPKKRKPVKAAVASSSSSSSSSSNSTPKGGRGESAGLGVAGVEETTAETSTGLTVKD